jgi:pseudouridine kinase
MSELYVLGVGAANVDVHGRSKNPIVMRDSNPGQLHTSAGGVTRNVLENLARQGVPTRLITAMGDDVYGDKIRAESMAAGIDVSASLLVPGASSSCYIAVLDERGDMLIGMSDMSILGNLTEEYLDRYKDLIYGAAAVVCDPCLPIPIAGHVAALSKGRAKVFLDPVSTAYARAVEPIIGDFFCVKPNRMELSVLSGVETDTDEGVRRGAEALLRRGVGQVCVSLGEKGCYYADAEGNTLFRSLRALPLMENATGAGDALMSGLIHGCVTGAGVEETLDYALACGIVSIMSDRTISPEMSDGRVRQMMREYAL